MATLKIQPGSNGSLWVTLTSFGEQDLARLKGITGRRWDLQRKQWQFPDTAGTRAALAEIVAMPWSPSPEILAVKPKNPHPDSLPSLKSGDRRGRRYVPGRDKPLTLNPPHPFIKQVDDELVLLDAASQARNRMGNLGFLP